MVDSAEHMPLASPTRSAYARYHGFIVFLLIYCVKKASSTEEIEAMPSSLHNNIMVPVIIVFRT